MRLAPASEQPGQAAASASPGAQVLGVAQAGAAGLGPPRENAGRGVLDGLRIFELSAFVAAPLAGLTLAQLGADVIRIDPLEGGPDRRRWPLAPNGESLYWAGLNKGKRSVRIDLRSERGRELAAELITAGGQEGGALLTNLPPREPLSFESLRARRPDLVMLRLLGSPDGAGALDYTVNAATGFPWAEGPRNLDEPSNTVMPAWDVATGTMAALGLLAAERHRSLTGEGQLVRIALSDVAFATVGALGWIGAAQLRESRTRQGSEAGQGADGAAEPVACRTRVKDGNHVHGAFGHDFLTRDARRVMVVALTERQWQALVAATGIGAVCRSIERATGLDFRNESGRYEARDLIAALLRPWFAARDLAQVRELLDAERAMWGPYQTFEQLVREDWRCSVENPMFAMVEHPGAGSYLAATSPIQLAAGGRRPPGRAPLLGEHTEQVLAEVLGLGAAEIGRLHKRGVVGGVRDESR